MPPQICLFWNTILGEKEAENLKSAEVNEPAFLIKLWNASQWTCDNIRRTNNNLATFTTQYKSQICILVFGTYTSLKEERNFSENENGQFRMREKIQPAKYIYIYLILIHIYLIYIWIYIFHIYIDIYIWNSTLIFTCFLMPVLHTSTFHYYVFLIKRKCSYLKWEHSNFLLCSSLPQVSIRQNQIQLEFTIFIGLLYLLVGNPK